MFYRCVVVYFFLPGSTRLQAAQLAFHPSSSLLVRLYLVVVTSRYVYMGNWQSIGARWLTLSICGSPPGRLSLAALFDGLLLCRVPPYIYYPWDEGGWVSKSINTMLLGYQCPTRQWPTLSLPLVPSKLCLLLTLGGSLSSLWPHLSLGVELPCPSWESYSTQLPRCKQPSLHSILILFKLIVCQALCSSGN
jgi:hypothetical protein